MKKTILFAICLLTLNSAYSQNLSEFKLGEKTGLKNQSGKIIVPAKYDSIYEFSEELAKVKNDGKYGAIDKSGKEIIPLIFDQLGNCSEGLIAYKKVTASGTKQTGYLDSKGNVAFYYEEPEDAIIRCYDFSDGVAIVGVLIGWQEYYGCIDKKGNKLFDFDETVTSVTPFSEGFAAVTCYNDGDPQCGYVNKKGFLAIPAKWKKADSFKNGRAKVVRNEKVPRYYNEEYDDYVDDKDISYYIDTSGNIIERIDQQ